MSSDPSERNRLVNLLFPDGYPSQWDFNNALGNYFSKLGSYRLEDLNKEPSRLKDERVAIEEQTQELAVTNYKTFIETAECSSKLCNQFEAIENKIDDLLENIPTFEDKIKSFSEKTSGISNQRKLNSLTLTRNAQLLEILELPQLMNSVINDGLYDDALELAAYARKLYNKYPEIPIFKSILDDINHAWLLMLHQLLTQLRQDLTLPKCLEIVGYLRRMEEFSELKLRLKFLQARNAWLHQCLNSIPTDDATYHLTKTIELTRVNLFNIITQYRAIFNDEEPTSNKSDNLNQNVIFYSWINNKIEEFLQTLEGDLKHVSSIETILDQCMYFGSSFSKVGCDFRSLLIPIFTKRIAENFGNSVDIATRNFEKNIERFTLINKNHPNIPWKSKSEDPMQPPDSLLEFYPLAEYLNSIVKSLNDLRFCAPLAVITEVVQSTQNSLIVIAKALLVLYLQEQQAFTSNSKDAFTRLCMSFSDDLVPYLQKCIHVIYPPSQIASMLGLNVQKLQEEQISFLNKNLIIEPIKHLLPAKFDPNLTFENDFGDNTIENNVRDETECKNEK